MKVRASAIFLALAVAAPVRSQESSIPVFRDFLVPPSLFESGASGKKTDPRERLAKEGITFGKDESITYDPVASRLFVRADTAKVLLLEKLVESEMTRSLARVFLTFQVIETRRPLFTDPLMEEGEPGKVATTEPSLTSSRVLARPGEAESIVFRVWEEDLGTVLPPSSLTVKSGQTADARIGSTLTRILPVISADSSTVEMELSLLEGDGNGGADPQLLGEAEIAVFSGGTAALEERLGETAWRTRLVTAAVVDSAGAAIPLQEPEGLPDGAAPPAPGLSLFPGPVPEPAIEKVKTIVLPSVEFENTPLSEAIETLKRDSSKHDRSLPESSRGVNLLFAYWGRSGSGERPVSLRLSNVPLIEAIRRTAESAGCDYRIEGGTVVIGDLVTTVPGGAEDLWYAAMLRQQQAGQLKESGKTAEASVRLLEAVELFEALREMHPEFHPKIVGDRIRALREPPKSE